ncbi:MAG: hypothetical protein Q4D22_02665 [Candidatus Saccharibacteria bacterium]|jgi:hypothetical protein|nr:hypothetical protein [Candidatus Saccharibacteria bacterium]
MKTKTNQFAVGIYTILFGLFGLRNFYLGEHERGAIRLISFLLTINYFANIRAQLRINLFSYELIDNLYVPSMNAASTTLYYTLNTIATIILVANIAWWIYDIISYFRTRKYPDQKISQRRFILNAILLGWTGIHDYFIERVKYANTHIIMLIISIAFLAVSQTNSLTHTAEYNGYMSILFIVGVAVLIANELIAIIEVINYLFAKNEQRKSKAK